MPSIFVHRSASADAGRVTRLGVPRRRSGLIRPVSGRQPARVKRVAAVAVPAADRRSAAVGDQARALALMLSNSAWVMVPASSSVLAEEISSAGLRPATD